MSIIEPGQDRTIGPEPAGPAPEPDVTALVADQVEEPAAPPAEPDTFPREYVEELRRENAKWRTKAQPYEEVFGDLDDEDRQAWLQIVQLANSGDPDAIQYLGQALGFVGEEPPVEEFAEQPQYLTPEQAREIARQEAQEMLAQEREQQSRVQQIESIQSRAKNEFNVEPGSDEYVVLLHRANQIDPADTPDGDLLKAAHEQIQAEKQAQWDAFIAQKQQEASNSPTTLTGQGQAPSTAQTPKTWAEARNSLHERLSNLP